MLISLVSEDNARTVALTSVAILEGVLEAAILRCFRPLEDDERASLIHGDAPLATLSAKIKLAYALKICGPGARDDLDCIREIRNAFAHAQIPINFETAQVATVCARLQFPAKMNLPPNLYFPRQSHSRSRFFVTINSLTLTLDDINVHGHSLFEGQLTY
jgi:DNA-binding MltR family transcriptional regulator